MPGVKNPPSPSFVHCLRRPARAERGFTLIEVMVALIVLVLGVLGAAAMTLTALKDNKQSGLRQIATAAAYEVADLMRASAIVNDPPTVASIQAVFTGGTPTAVSSCWYTGCTPLEMANNNYYEWRMKTVGPGGTPLLPNADARICRDASNLGTSTPAIAAASYATCDNAATSPFVVKLRWEEKVNVARDATASATSPVQQAYLFVPIRPY